MTPDNPKNTHAVLLGAGRPWRGRLPAPLKGKGDGVVMDWLVNTYANMGAKITFVGGYRLQDVTRRYPHLTYAINPEWENTGSFFSLSCVDFEPDATYWVSYTDIVYTPSLVREIEKTQGDVVIGLDPHPEQRFERRSQIDIKRAGLVVLDTEGMHVVADYEETWCHECQEVVGLIKLSPRAVRVISELIKEMPSSARKWHLNNLVEYLHGKDLDIRVVDASGQWAELNAPQDMANFIMGTKASTLDRLSMAVRKSRVQPQVSFSVKQWKDDSESIVSRIVNRFGGSTLAVRSSSLSEDCWDKSNAGAFLSLLDVTCELTAVHDAIKRVIDSFGASSAQDEVLVQPMLDNVLASGVAFTRTLSHRAPYYVVNYEISSRTDAVTSGGKGNLETMVLYRDWEDYAETVPDQLKTLFPALVELEKLCGHDSLDCEFAITEDGSTVILQARPMAGTNARSSIEDDDVDKALAEARTLYQSYQVPLPNMRVPRTIFGVMPDWNPAEIIGTRPQILAFSLYRHLITDEVWATHRAEFGYRDVRPSPLIHLFAGQPYVDVRASFTSFIPASVPDDLAEKLVSHYLDRLEANPAFHDKVEFDILFTCLDFDFAAQSKRLLEAGFTRDEITIFEDGLRQVTLNGFARCQSDFDAITAMDERRQAILASELQPLAKALALLDDCRRHGTLTFSHLAREGFIAVTLLRSLERAGHISSDDITAFFKSLETVAKRLCKDTNKVIRGQLEFEELVAKYGHLRPGTYNITSPCYASDPERYFQLTEQPEEDEAFQWTKRIRQVVSEKLMEICLPIDFDAFERFLRLSIEGRELGKFVFSMNLSAALELIAEYGESIGLTREQVSNLSIHDLQAAWVGQLGADITSSLLAREREGRRLREISQAIELPALIINPEDFFSFHYAASLPNYVGSGCCEAELYKLEASDDMDLEGKIALIRQADPGYDWLLGKGIAGLITCYGGANSHMAIRAAELSLPAAIGVGDRQYRELAKARMVKLDCGSRTLEAL